MLLISPASDVCVPFIFLVVLFCFFFFCSYVFLFYSFAEANYATKKKKQTHTFILPLLCFPSLILLVGVPNLYTIGCGKYDSLPYGSRLGNGGL